MAKKEEYRREGSPFVGIGASLGGISIAIVALFLIFAKEYSAFTIPIVGFLALMGIFLGFFAYKKK